MEVKNLYEIKIGKNSYKVLGNCIEEAVSNLKYYKRPNMNVYDAEENTAWREEVDRGITEIRTIGKDIIG